MKTRILKTSAAVIAALIVAVPAFAQVGLNASMNGSVDAGRGIRAGIYGSTTASTTRTYRNRGTSTTTIQDRIQNGQNRGSTETTARIDSLNKLLSRVSSMKNLSSSEIASFTAEIQTEVSDMTSLETKIQSDNSTTSLRADLQTIAPDYRIYMLIDPQISLLSAVDRVNTLVSSLQTIQTKIQARVSADASLSGNTTITADMSDMTAKLSDATTQATAAQAEISGLQPDQGNQTTMQSNTAALKDARSKIQTAQNDLASARKDAGAVIKIIVQSDQSLNGGTSGTVSASSSSH